MATKRKSGSKGKCKSNKSRKKRSAEKVKRAPSRKLKCLENAHIRNLLVELAGEKALKVVGELTVPMSDEELAASAKIKISDVRAVMNKLHSAGVAAYSRSKNDEGWFTYTWYLCADKLNEMVSEQSKKNDDIVQPEATSADGYICPICFERNKKRFSFEKAVEIEFRCPECSEMLKYVEK